MDIFLCLAVQNLGHPYWLTLAPMYIWFIIFFIQPHKEERFLFPVYPLICLCGAVALSALQVSFREMYISFILFHILNCSLSLKANYKMLPPKIFHPFIKPDIDHIIKTLCSDCLAVDCNLLCWLHICSVNWLCCQPESNYF